MVRVSEEEKRRSHWRILDAAAKLMRERGVESTSISDIMSAAGLTHGGFYRHFSSKDELAAAAFTHAVESVVASIESSDTPARRGEAYEEYVASYLSQRHVTEYGGGCPLAAIGVEAGRRSDALRSAAAAAVRRIAILLDDPQGAKPEGPPGRGMAIMAVLLGSVTLARLTEDPAEATATLAAGEAAVDAILECWSNQGEAPTTKR